MVITEYIEIAGSECDPLIDDAEGDQHFKETQTKEIKEESDTMLPNKTQPKKTMMTLLNGPSEEEKAKRPMSRLSSGLNAFRHLLPVSYAHICLFLCWCCYNI